MRTATIVRAFNHSLADAEGLLALEKELFDESPYSPQDVQAMLTGGPQRAWVAVAADDRIVGFCIAFPTRGLHGTSWEIDLLAVHPEWTRQGVATRLIRAASAYGARQARQARAVVATDNPASARAFARAGFQPAETCQLWICRPQDEPPAPWTASDVKIRPAAGRAELDAWLPGELSAAGDDLPAPREQPDPTVCSAAWLLAERNGQPAGYAERIEVHTLLYRGVWIESLVAPTEPARAALIHATVERAAAAGLDEVGAMVPEQNAALSAALLAAGFRSLGTFRWLRARLPLPGLTGQGEDTRRG